MLLLCGFLQIFTASGSPVFVIKRLNIWASLNIGAPKNLHKYPNYSQNPYLKLSITYMIYCSFALTIQ